MNLPLRVSVSGADAMICETRTRRHDAASELVLQRPPPGVAIEVGNEVIEGSQERADHGRSEVGSGG